MRPPLVLIAAGAALGCGVDLSGTRAQDGAGGGAMVASSSAVTGGGAGGEGGADGLPGGVLYTWAARDPEQPGIYALPLWLTLESPTPSKTVQVSESALVSGIPAGVPRARRLRADGPWGLSLEGARENRVVVSTPSMPAWLPLYAATLEPVPGPDGQMSAARVSDVDAANHAAVYANISGDSDVPLTVSAWVSDVAGMEDDFAWLRANSFEAGEGGAAGIEVSAPVDAWRRVDFSGVQRSSTGQLLAYPTAAHGTRTGAARFAFINLEPGRYPTSAIPTSGAAARREADVLYANNAAWLFWRGRIKAVIELAPSYASGEQLVDHDLLYIDERSRVFVRASDGAIAATMAGARGAAATAVEGLRWERNQAIRVEVASSSAGLSLHVAVEGGQEASGSDPKSVGAIAVPESGRIHILGGPGGSQESADLRRIEFHEVD